jgi:hypothetical protein
MGTNFRSWDWVRAPQLAQHEQSLGHEVRAFRGSALKAAQARRV